MRDTNNAFKMDGMQFYDFLYYLIFKFYSNYNEKGVESTSAAIIGGFQTLNVVSIILIISLFYPQKIYFDKLIGVLLFLVFQIYTYIRYIYMDKYSIEFVEQKWFNKTERYRKRTRIIGVLYGIISLFGFFGLALFLGSRK